MTAITRAFVAILAEEELPRELDVDDCLLAYALRMWAGEREGEA